MYINCLTLALLLALQVAADGERYGARRYNATQQTKGNRPQGAYVPSTRVVFVPPQYHVTLTQFHTQSDYLTQFETVTVTQTKLVPRYRANMMTVTLRVTERVTQPVTTSITRRKYVTVEAKCPATPGGNGGRGRFGDMGY